MHTFLTYAYSFSMVFAALALFLATAIYLYAFISLFFASYATVETRQGDRFILVKEQISVNWAVPATFLIGAVLWTLIATGFHSLL